MQVNKISQTIGFKSLNHSKKLEDIKPEIETDKTCENKRIGNAKIDSNGIIKVATHIENTLDSNMWYELNKTGTAKVYSCWTKPGKETVTTTEELKALYKYAYDKLSENNGTLNNEDALWIANRINLYVYDD